MSFYKEPIINCEKCGEKCRAEWVDIGFGTYSQQAGPFHCHSCGWTEGGCPQIECVKERCLSWEYCQGEAIL
jgi:hypothetical protein